MALADLLTRSLKNTRLKPAQVPFLNQALAEAAVRYEPLWDQANMAREQSARSMRQGQQQAVSGAQLIAALAGQARQGVQQDNSPAIQQALAYQHAPEGSSTQRTGLGISLGHDATANLLAQMAGAAPIRANQQVQQLTAQHSEDLDRINAQRRSLIGQAGQYTVGRFGDLTEANRKQRADLNKQFRTLNAEQKRAELGAETRRRGQDVTARGQDLSHQDRQAAIDQRRDAANRPGGPKSPFLNPNQQSGVVAKVKGAQKGIEQLAGRKSQKTNKPITRDQIETLLRAGQVDGVKYSQPQIDVAMDLYHNQGKLSNRGVRVLHGTLRTQAKGNFGLAPRIPRRRQPKVGPPAPAGPAGPVTVGT